MKATDRRKAMLVPCAVVICGVVAASFSLCFAQPPAAPVPVAQQSGKVIVADVIINISNSSGPPRITVQQIQSMLRTRAGGEYSPELVEEDTRALYATRQYANIQV